MGQGCVSHTRRVHPVPTTSTVPSTNSTPRLKPADLDFSSLTRGVSAVHIPDVAARGILPSQLQALVSFMKERCFGEGVIEGWYDDFTKQEQLKLCSVNLYQVMTWVIKPMTAPASCSYVERVAVSADAQRPRWFISHWWGEPVVDFLACVATHQRLRGLPEETAYWVCAYANNQHDLGAEIKADPRETSFFRAMRACDGVLLVLDGEATPFTRVWCSFEEATAVSTHRREEELAPLLLDIATAKEWTDLRQRSYDAALITQGLTQEEQQIDSAGEGNGWYYKAQREGNFPSHLVEKALALDVERSQASQAVDRTRILNSIAGRLVGELDAEPLCGHPAYARVNRQLRATFAVHGWLGAVGARPELLRGLAQAVHEDWDRTELHLTFAGCRGFTDERLREVASGLSPSLQRLQLILAVCEGVSDAGLLALAAALPAGLAEFELNVSSCAVGDGGVAGTVEVLPRGLRELKLRAQRCERVGDLGRLAAGLPPGLRRLLLSFAGCPLPEEGLQGLAAELVGAELEELELDFSGCERLGDESLFYLARALPGTLQRLSLRLQQLPLVSSEGITFFGGLPRGLLELEFLVSGCALVGDEGVAALVAELPPTLRRLALDFSRCRKLTDAALMALKLPAQLEQLELRFSFCDAITDTGLRRLAAALPVSLRRLDLVCNGCSQLSEATAAAVGQDIRVEDVRVLAAQAPRFEAPAGDGGARGKVEQALREISARIQFEEPSSISLDEAVMDSGMDSLATVQFRSEVSRTYPTIRLSAGFAFDYPTIRQMAAHILTQLEEGPGKVEQALREISASILAEEPSSISLDKAVMESGMDSLSTVSFASEVSRKYPTISLSPAFAFDYPTIRQMAAHILKTLEEEGPAL